VAKIVECVPNFSEGRRREVVEAIIQPFRETAGVKLLDYSLDQDHNRSVVTVVGEPEPLKEAVFQAIALAARLIDLNQHQGEHPRMGAADVVPFIPVRDVTMADCVSMSRELGERVGRELNIPVYLYEEAAAMPHRQNLADIRKGQFEGFSQKIQQPGWQPDFGPGQVHPTAGVTAIGARMPLIAYNINLGKADKTVADQIAKRIRYAGGGLRYVKAVGVYLKEREMAQVSINMTNYVQTALYQVFEMVKVEARRYGVPVVGSEIVGLVPAAALLDAAAYYLQLEGFSPQQVLENRLE